MKKKDTMMGGFIFLGIVCSLILVSYSVLPVLWQDTCKIKNLRQEVQESEDKLADFCMEIEKYKEDIREFAQDNYHYERIAREELLLGVAQETVYLCS